MADNVMFRRQLPAHSEVVLPDTLRALETAAAPASAAMQLARVAMQGDLAATQRLLVTITPRVTRVVRAVLGGGHPDVDDVTQQALIGFVQSLPGFRCECEPASFATQIAVRAAMLVARRSRQARTRHDDAVELDALAAGSARPDTTVDGDRLKETLRELLAQIPEEQAEALALRVVLGWSLEEVARATHVPSNTVRSRVRLAKQALRARIERDPGLAVLLGRDD